MGFFGLFGGNKGTAPSNVMDVNWSRNEKGKFRRLAMMEVSKENLHGTKAIYVLWHGGMKPGWVYVGMADDLAMDLTDARQNREIMDYDTRGGLFVTWATFPDEMMPGIFAFLNDVLAPEMRNPEADMYQSRKQVKILPPGYSQESFAQLLAKR